MMRQSQRGKRHLVHVDGFMKVRSFVQTLKDHAAVGGWFEKSYTKEKRITPLKGKPTSRALNSWRAVIRELDGVYGVWNAMKTTIYEKGVSLLFSGNMLFKATPKPFLFNLGCALPAQGMLFTWTALFVERSSCNEPVASA
jgi:hypothetical protein